MIISHTHRFIYIRPKKVASSSLALAFAPFLSPGDSATPFSDKERSSIPEGSKIIEGGFRSRWPLKLRVHSPLQRVYRIYGNSLRNYRVISATRNPWDRAISHFYWINRDTDLAKQPFETRKQAFRQFIRTHSGLGLKQKLIDRLENRKRRNMLDQSELYHINGENRADCVIRFENLEADLQAVGRKLGLPAPLSLPRQKAKAGIRPKTATHWQEYYDTETRALVEEACAREIALFAYSFDSAQPGDVSPLPFSPCRTDHADHPDQPAYPAPHT